MSFSKFSDTEAVLVKADAELLQVSKSYNELLETKEIPDELKVDVKNILGNLRSALDFTSQRQALHNFPIGNSEKDFEKRVEDFPVEIKKFLRTLMPYKDWWIDFSVLNNKHKHISLVPQKRIETQKMELSHNGAKIQLNGGGKIIIGEGASFTIGGASISGGQVIAPDTSFSHDPRIVVKKEVWVDFLFDNTDLPSLSDSISVLPFLKNCFFKITVLIKDMESYD